MTPPLTTRQRGAQERQILFSGPMVRALLAGTKTQTRRVADLSKRPGFIHQGYDPRADEYLRCPYGVRGDRLWVRETWQYADWTEDGYPFIGYAADASMRLRDKFPPEWSERVSDAWADLSAPANYTIDGRAADRKWRPSIFMPRWASRLTLELTDVRVERVQDISETDAKAEGVEPCGVPGHDDCYYGSRAHRCAYRALWDSLNNTPKRPYGWDVNPWVWVLSFARVSA